MSQQAAPADQRVSYSLHLLMTVPPELRRVARSPVLFQTAPYERCQNLVVALFLPVPLLSVIDAPAPIELPDANL